MKVVIYLEDTYKILDVSPNSSDEEIKKIYKRLAKKYHPDNYAIAPKSQQKQAEDKMKEINAAYDAIKLERSRPKSPYKAPEAQGFSLGRKAPPFLF